MMSNVREELELAAFIREVDGDNRMGASQLAEKILDWQAAREKGGEAVAWRVSHPEQDWRVYDKYPGWAHGDFSIQPLYTHPAPLVPEVASEVMLTEGVEALIRGLKAFPSNYTRVVSNIWEDMAAAANPPEQGADDHE